MKAVKFYHNPRCSKSRQALALLEARGIRPEIRLYLHEPLDRDEITALLELLDMSPAELLRSGEEACRQLGVDATSPAEQIISAMVREPKLIQRPIAATGSRAVIGHPPENVLELLA